MLNGGAYFLFGSVTSLQWYFTHSDLLPNTDRRKFAVFYCEVNALHTF